MKSLLLFTALLFTLSSPAQKIVPKLSFGKELKKSVNPMISFGNDKGELYNVGWNVWSADKLTITRIDPVSLDIVNEKELKLERSKQWNYEGIIEMNKTVYWMHSDLDKETGKEFLYADAIDFNTGNFVATKNLIHETTKMAGVKSNSMGSYGRIEDKYDLVFDKEHKKMLVVYRLAIKSTSDKKNIDVFGLQVFDENMKKIWGGEFEMPYTEYRIKKPEFSVDPTGNVSMVAEIRGEGDVADHYEVMQFKKGSATPVISKVETANFFITEPKLVYNPVHGMMFVATYSKTKETISPNGIFVATLSNAKAEKFKQGLYDFPVEEIKKFETKGKQEKLERDPKVKGLHLIELDVNSKGDLFIRCEELFYDGDTNLYDNMYCMKINAAGNMEWTRKLPKKVINGENKSMVKVLENESGYYLFYLDNIKNKDLPEDQEPAKHNNSFGGYLVMTHISNTGVVTKEWLQNMALEEVRLNPATLYKMPGGKFMATIPNRTYSRYKIMLMSIQ